MTSKKKKVKIFNKRRRKKSWKTKRNHNNSNEGGKTCIGFAYWLEKVKAKRGSIYTLDFFFTGIILCFLFFFTTTPLCIAIAPASSFSGICRVRLFSSRAVQSVALSLSAFHLCPLSFNYTSYLYRTTYTYTYMLSYLMGVKILFALCVE
jgi:hypothetical protein